MNYLSCLSIASLTILLCTNWSNQETTVDGYNKQAVNFKGVIITQRDETIKVENISIGRMYKQIPVYDVPKNNTQATAQPTANRLSTDPKDGIVTRIDLSEIAQIMVPDPDTLWIYQKNKHARKIEYITINVISNDTQQTKHTYLIDIDRKLVCDEINEAGPITKDIPLPAIKSLTISCFGPREAQEPKKPTKTCPSSSQACPICPVQPTPEQATP